MKESTLCKVASYCKDYLNVQLSFALKETPDKDLIDQHYELCTHPAEEVKESCENYKMIKKSFVNETEETLRNWHPEQIESCYPTLGSLRSRSSYNRLLRLSQRGIRTWQR